MWKNDDLFIEEYGRRITVRSKRGQYLYTVADMTSCIYELTLGIWHLQMLSKMQWKWVWAHKIMRTKRCKNISGFAKSVTNHMQSNIQPAEWWSILDVTWNYYFTSQRTEYIVLWLYKSSASPGLTVHFGVGVKYKASEPKVLGLTPAWYSIDFFMWYSCPLFCLGSEPT